MSAQSEPARANLGGTARRKAPLVPLWTRGFLFQRKEEMSQIFVWVTAIFSILYGTLTSFAGYGQIRENKIQTWAAWGLVLCGMLVITAGIMILFDSISTLWILVVGLLGIHALAINNGIKLFGKINPGHHLARLLLSVVLVTLTYLGLK
jgi:hypothetical protein